MYTAMLLGKINWPTSIDKITKDFIEKLLVKDCKKRLGHGEYGSNNVKEHRYDSNQGDH